MIPVSEPNLCGNELKYATDAINSTWISSVGSYIEKFEEQFRAYTGCKHAVAVSNGTVALHLGLLAAGIGEGDEVIVPNLTFIATANAVRYVGGTPVFADIDADTWNISLESVERLITPKTRAVIPVHIYGHAVDMDPLRELARRHKLFVLEDAAEAIGTEYRGRRVGVFGEVATFSLYGNKTITTGEGGFVTTDNAEFAEKMRLLKDQAMSKTKRYWFEHVGYNYRMTNVQAAIGCAQMENIDRFVASKRENAALYNKLLSERFQKPVDLGYGKNSYWIYATVLPEGVDRDRFCAALKEKGIETRPFFYLLSTMPPYEGSRAEISARTRSLVARGINLPSSTKLTEEQIAFVCETANKNLK